MRVSSAVARVKGISMRQHLAFMQSAIRAGEDGALALAHKAGVYSHDSVKDRVDAQLRVLEALPASLKAEVRGVDEFVDSRRRAAQACAKYCGNTPASTRSLLSASEGLGGFSGGAQSVADDIVASGHRFIDQQRDAVVRARDAPAGPGRLVGHAIEALTETLVSLDVSSGHLARQWAAVTRAVATHASERESASADGQSLKERLEAGTVVGWYSLEELAQVAVEDASAFCAEKYGAAPQVRVRVPGEKGHFEEWRPDPDRQTRNVLTPCGAASAVVALAHTEYALIEVLKNSMGAHVRRFGALDVDDDELPSITIDVSAHGAQAGWRVTDHGGGCAHPGAALDMFSSASAKRAPCADDAPTSASGGRAASAPEGEDWRYSRSFGAAFSGFGMGLCRSNWYLRLMGGPGISLLSLPGHGCVAAATFPRHGNVEDIVAIRAAAGKADTAIAAWAAARARPHSLLLAPWRGAWH
ncbi:hypothetical protein FNF31_04398 [Cafeteria roenbergensis]|uniref:Protein-serine/threonine kinase n=1 Tax=Cafeteria roenbergensis TaxID=33653 RepID=A0A5A8D8J0_CAFRO|nr:hypothetical protein FNF31_04398 [Cafeteria roenbergensis]